jgi:hypothetical protein
MELFKIVVAGGRGFNDYELLKGRLDSLIKTKSKTHEIVVVSGTAKGADLLGERYAADRELSVMKFPAQWDLYGKSAGYKRNAHMASVSDAVVVFWDGKSKGSKHMIDIAKRVGLPLRVVKY